MFLIVLHASEKVLLKEGCAPKFMTCSDGPQGDTNQWCGFHNATRVIGRSGLKRCSSASTTGEIFISFPP